MFSPQEVTLKAGLRALEDRLSESTEDVIWMTPGEFLFAMRCLGYETIYRPHVVGADDFVTAMVDGWVRISVQTAHGREVRWLRRYDAS
jgi:hypothetical protein